MKRICSSIIISILLFIVGCAGLIHKKPLTLDNVTIAEIRNRLEQNNLKYHSLRADADISMESPRINFTARSRIIVKKPDSVLITIRGPFGIGFGAFFIDKEQFLAYNSYDNKVYTGNREKLEQAQFLPINLKLEDLIQALSGIQLLDSFDKDSLAIDHKKYLIIGSKDNQIRKYWIDPDKAVVTEFQLWIDIDEPLIKLEYKQFEKKDQFYLPKFIQIYQPKENTRLTILYTKREPNSQLSKKDFRLKIPEQAGKKEL